MPRITYQNFDLIFAPTQNKGEYSARVLGGSGDAKSVFLLTDILTGKTASPEPAENKENDDLATRHINFASTVTNPEKYYLTRRRPPPDFTEAKNLGGALFKSVFNDAMRVAFEVKRRQLDNKVHLRIRLNLTDVPELAVLPWEYLYNADSNHFYAQLPGSPVIRYLDIGESIEDLTVEEELRMLVVISAPSGAAQLDVEKEWQKLKDVMKPLEDKNLIQVERLDLVTLQALQDKLQEQNNPFHIFHFIGHGVFERETGKGFLLFEDENRAGRLVSGEELGMILNGQGLRLAVINACEGAISAEMNSYAGVAQTLCREAVIPAVLAMQYEITDNAAITFAQNFYRALTRNFPIEAALGEARKAIRTLPNEIEWATPVLYMRSEDGHLSKEKDGYELSVAGNGDKPAINQPELSPELVDHYNKVFGALRDGQLVPFVGLDANLLGRPSDPETWALERGLPDSAELARHLSRRFNYPLSDLPDLARIAQFSIAANRLGDLYDEISNIFSGSVHQPTALHSTIAELAAKVTEEAENENATFLLTKDSLRRRFIVATTGYDNLFEEAFKKAVRNFHIVSYTARGAQPGKFLHFRYVNSNLDSPPVYITSPNDYSGLADGNPVILKLPGTVETVDPRFAITEDDYFEYLTNRELTNLLPSVITGKLKASNHLFLGYSPRSWNMRALLYRIWEEQRRNFRESWAVLSDPKSLDVTFWRACNVTIVTSDLDKYIEGLRARALAI